MLFNIDKSHKYWDGYLKGIIAAEGHMELRKKYTALSRISIAQTRDNFRKSIMRALKARNIRYYTDEEYIKISGKKNFDIILERGLYNLHPKKKKQFLIGYYNIKQNQYYSDEVLKLLLNELKTPKRISTIAENLNRCRKTIRDHMLLKDNSYYKQKIGRASCRERV